jgi:hypothetical protein
VAYAKSFWQSIQLNPPVESTLTTQKVTQRVKTNKSSSTHNTVGGSVKVKGSGSRNLDGSIVENHGRTARDGHGLLQVSLEPAMPNPSRPCGRATPKTAERPYQGWHVHRASGLRPSSTLLDTPRLAHKLKIFNAFFNSLLSKNRYHSVGGHLWPDGPFWSSVC